MGNLATLLPQQGYKVFWPICISKWAIWQLCYHSRVTRYSGQYVFPNGQSGNSVTTAGLPDILANMYFQMGNLATLLPQQGCQIFWPICISKWAIWQLCYHSRVA